MLASRLTAALLTCFCMLALASCATNEPLLPGKPDLVMNVGERVSMMSEETLRAGWRPSVRHSSRDKNIVRIEYDTREDGFRVPVFVALSPGVARIRSYTTSIDPVTVTSERDSFGNPMDDSMNQVGHARYHEEGQRIILVR